MTSHMHPIIILHTYTHLSESLIEEIESIKYNLLNVFGDFVTVKQAIVVCPFHFIIIKCLVLKLYIRFLNILGSLMV